MNDKKSINLDPLIEFFADNTPPKELAQTLDDILFDYVTAVNRLSLSDHMNLGKDLNEHIFCLKTLRDIFRSCESQKDLSP